MMLEHHRLQECRYNALDSSVIFCIWSGDNEMSPNRRDALLSVYRETCCPVMMISPISILRWEAMNSPMHPALAFLSETHRSDYLRCYLMHNYGGGYTDIKRTSGSWIGHFHALRSSPSALALGYPEPSEHVLAPVGGQLEANMRREYRKMIGNCAYIFKPKTELTTEWIYRTHAVLDAKHEALIRNPAKHPQDELGKSLPDGTNSSYPIRWTELLGNVFHPLVYEFRDKIIRGEIAPSFQDHR